MSEHELFQNITKEDVLKALQEIDENGVEKGAHSSTYDVVYNGKRYPPKLVASLAYKYANGELLPRNTFKGGEDTPAFQFLESLDFEIEEKNTSQSGDVDNVENNKSRYTWVPTYKEIVNYLKDKKDDQIGLINLLKDSGCDVFNDQDPKDNVIDLEEIDPFTFFCYINKYFKQRLEILQNLAKIIKVSIPTDDLGIPSANPQKVWLFPYKYARKNNEIERLWEFFHSALHNNISDEQFEDILAIKGVAKTKITEGLFYVDPLHFFPINGPVKPFLKGKFGIDPNFNSFTEYKNILEQIKRKTDMPFYQLSSEAWVWNDNQKNTNTKGFAEYLAKFSHQDLCTYFSFLFETLDRFHIEPGDKRILYSTTNNNLAFIIGQRYSWVLHKSDKKGKFAVLSIDKIRPNSEQFTGNQPYPFFTYLDEIDFSPGDITSIFKGFEQELERTNKSGFRKHVNKEFERALFDSSFREKYSKSRAMKNENKALNRILYGPPGTGKTYYTKELAVKTVMPNFYLDEISSEEEKRKKILEHYDNMVEQGNIVFTTFHQSYSYEDFVEGIKPVLVGDGETEEGQSEIAYEVKDGIFKEIVENIKDQKKLVATAQGDLYIPAEKFQQPINKISLGNSQVAEDEQIYNFCIQNGCIAIGFGEGIDFTGVSSRVEIREKYRQVGIEISGKMDFNISAIERFVIWMKPGQLVFVSHGTKKLKAIGEIVGDYYFESNPEIEYNHFRKVKWLYTDIDLPIKNIYGKLFSQQTIYQIDHRQLKYEEYFSKTKPVSLNDDQNFVIIIDEINRGNVSAVFGELITLIEPDKRLGEKEEITLKLPYSRAEFGIPSNLYIIGTMNTADRSVEALDTALRRRFSFEEMTPKPKKLRDKEIGGINLGKLLQVINARVELLVDRDHTIGHSYFMNLKQDSLGELAAVFNDKIVPLLQEYFYGDFGKIGLVLGKGFVRKKNNKEAQFADFEYENQEDFKNDTYSLNHMTEGTILEALEILLNTRKSNEEA